MVWLGAALALVASCSGSDGSGSNGAGGGGGGTPSIEVVGGRPEFVSGDTAVLAVYDAAGEPAGLGAATKIEIDGGAAVATFLEGESLVRLTELSPGDHKVEVTSGDITATADLTVFPIEGPMFSGPHLQPLVCSTEANGLGPPTDQNCSAPRITIWRYIAEDGSLQPLEDPTVPPPDVKRAMVGENELPLIIRTEQGVINRSPYWISVLDPDGVVEKAANGEVPTINDAWNGRLIYEFGGGCGTAYAQGTPLLGGMPGLDPDLLTKGYALATATFNTFQVSCNDVLSAETALMVKQRAGTVLGPIQLTLGMGGSGGAIQQLMIAQNYPGILDALVAAVPFPDNFSMAPGVTDCGLLNRYFASGGSALTPAQRAAITGHATAATCENWQDLFLDTVDPTKGCNAEIPADEIYSPANPDGVRCTLTDLNINTLGRDPSTGFADRPLDNTGVEYGLEALLDGVIDGNQFLDLNERIGSFDVDGKVISGRSVADVDQVTELYEKGRIQSGGGDLGSIPIMLLNIYSDPTGDIHDRFRSFSILSRIDSENGNTNNVSLITRGGGSLAASISKAGKEYMSEMVSAADEWASNLLSVDGWKRGENQPHAAGLERGAVAEAMTTTRPKKAESNCIEGSDLNVVGDEAKVADGPCSDQFPVNGNSRIVAGAPIGDDIVKCALVPVDPGVYVDGDGRVLLDSDQIDRLRSIFPDGVCDYSVRGPGDSNFKRPWARYGT